MKGFFILAMATLTVIAIWFHFDAIHSFALASARRHCQDLDVQLLDQTVVLRGLRFGRRTSGSVCLITKYVFEFSTTGERRYKGVMEFAGKKRLSIELEPHVVH